MSAEYVKAGWLAVQFDTNALNDALAWEQSCCGLVYPFPVRPVYELTDYNSLHWEQSSCTHQAFCTHIAKGQQEPLLMLNRPSCWDSKIPLLLLVCSNTLIPELQATAKPPSIVTMKKAIWMLYGQLTLTYLPAAFVGYAAYGEHTLDCDTY